MKTKDSKYKQLENIVQGGKEEYLKKISGDTKDQIAQKIAGSYPAFIKDALSQIFDKGISAFRYINGENRKTSDFWVKKEWMDLDKIKSRDEGLAIIKIIEDYLYGELGHFYSPLASIKRTPLKEHYYTGLISFYMGIVRKYIFDTDEFDKKTSLAKEFLKTGLFSEKSESAIEEYKKLFNVSNEDIYNAMYGHISKTLKDYIDLEDLEKLQQDEQANGGKEPIEKVALNYMKALNEVKESTEFKEKNGIIDKYDVMELGYFLSSIRTTESIKLIEIIKKVSLTQKDFHTYSMFSYLTSKLGKSNLYKYTVGGEQIVGYYQGKKIKAVLYEDDNKDEGLLFFDDNHRKKLTFKDIIDLKSKTDQYVDIVNQIYPDDILGKDGRQVNFDDIGSTLTEIGRFKVRMNQMKIEYYSEFSLTPAKSHFIYFKTKDQSINHNYTYYILEKDKDEVNIHIKDYPMIFENLEACSEKGDFYEENLSPEIFTRNISECIKQAKFLVENFKIIEKEIDCGYAKLLHTKTIGNSSKDTLKKLGERQYPKDYLITKSLKDRFGNNLYFISSYKDNYFEIIKFKPTTSKDNNNS